MNWEMLGSIGAFGAFLFGFYLLLRTDMRRLEDKMDSRMDRIDDRLDRMDGRLDRMDGRLDETNTRLSDVSERLARMEERRGSDNGTGNSGESDAQDLYRCPATSSKKEA